MTGTGGKIGRMATFAAARAAFAMLAASVLIAAAPARAGPAIGSQEDAMLIGSLVRATLIGLHQANDTGNYSVLRDMATPAFQKRNTAADLAVIFADLRSRHIDLQAAAVLQPHIDRPPVIDTAQTLRVSGSFATKPLPVAFSLGYRVVDHVWRLDDITVSLAPSPPAGKPPARKKK